MLNARSPHANCDIAIFDGIYGTDVMIHLRVNDMVQGNNLAITQSSEMSFFISIFMSNSDIC